MGTAAMSGDFSLTQPDLVFLISLVRLAGQEIMDVYGDTFEVNYKEDQSPLTQADLRSHQVITSGLQLKFPHIPILSEESRQIPYETRKHWLQLWLVDPLDGTKEFIKRNGEFTINIALIASGRPVLGLVYLPVSDVCYYASRGQGAFRQDGNDLPERLQAPPLPATGALTVIGSRSHHSEAMTVYLETLKSRYDDLRFVSAGSALKFCRIAEGQADIYPRLAPTMEWDTAAGQIIVEESGKSVQIYETTESLQYNRENLVNPSFICC